MTDLRRKREVLIPLALLLSALLLNWLGMGSGPLTLGRGLGLGAYILLTLSLCFWTFFQWGKVLWSHKKGGFFSTVILLWFLLIWPFTPTAGRLNHRLLDPARETAIRAWQEGTRCQTGDSSWYVGTASWDRNLYVTEGGEVFAFCIYNSFFKSCDAIYSPNHQLEEGDRLEPLGGGWYWVLYNTF